MKPAAWILLLFVCSGGLSALLGNELGRKIGKKKLSLFAMRPKYTSTFMTVILSMALSAGLFGSYLAVSGKTRMALLNPEFLLSESSEKEQAHQSELVQVLRRLKTQNRVQVAKLAQQEITLAALPQPIQPPLAPKATARQAVIPAPQSHQNLKPEPLRLAKAEMPMKKSVQHLAPKALPKALQTHFSSQDLRLKVSHGVEPHRPASRASGPELAQTHRSQKSYVFMAKANETLMRFEAMGLEENDKAQAAMARVLDLTEAYAQQMGLPETEGSRIRVSEANIQQVLSSLENHSGLGIEVKTASAVLSSQPMSIQLSAYPLVQQENLRPQDILEQDRLQPEGVQADLRQEILPAIRTALALKQPLAMSSLPPIQIQESTWVSPLKIELVRTRSAQVHETLLDSQNLRILLWFLP
ncbi:hypothetical protein COW36_08780 [bacterium (Candidatus Blackallbacteria) CG17_big_fil_post_rev_8_21_14_2_50_48_46]|uniref:DUF3084 domain-containing protein n=1 Tax=bacterium (Candidatus Blackallbacteria) CG17_big_fil_post_rev_8_21_14_2_50_48_46 TaxID=2014261 RepID=A0A2M7G6K8_9BACT|nr:MAG: hypothetical protein COW64_06080 [bacterium (Candidatus Blackallbacteria) CG18_big_fil_WC_8_21_14_2_50_49_26]PIW17579.1 MAG: hypothetical protein COW36_08780 [bacterium (Candidatus Blackallbacteria) CG17_big_fil_post_rev_8_21_14_2_50_48_46]PIW48434.1 MAG: hypothetical protein COW20_10130 [bacterium (Candidatus Blackallbacteria) CG13_big_fil_rev_8_21_14_2_50_49_14]